MDLNPQSVAQLYSDCLRGLKGYTLVPITTQCFFKVGLPVDVYALIRQAIIDKKIVRAKYRGYIRLMCPHAIGRKNGQKHALFYQFAGGSSKPLSPDGSKDNWKCMHVNRLSEVSIQDGEWHTANSHTQPQSCIDRIDVEVAY